MAWGTQPYGIRPWGWQYDVQTSTSGLSSICHQFEVGPVIGSGVLTYNTPVISARSEDLWFEDDTGWKWDERVWFGETTDNWAAFVPANWDPTTSGITTSYFQSGIGSNRDLELIDVELVPSSGLQTRSLYNIWAPEIQHGYYYDFEDEGYLYSDDSEVAYPTYSGITTASENYNLTISGFNQVDLDSIPQVGVPVRAEQYEWNPNLGKYDLFDRYRKKILFTGQRDDDLVRQDTYNTVTGVTYWSLIDQDEKEFQVIYSGVSDGGPVVALFNQQAGSEVGSPALEQLGISDGSAGQQFHLKYSPVDNSQGVLIYSSTTIPDSVSYSGISSWESIPFSSGLAVDQVKVDYDLGILEFGDPDLSDQNTPAAGNYILANYWKTFRIEYEPQASSNTIIATEANINPIYRRSGQGFVYLSTELEDPSTIELTAQLPEIQTDVYGPLAIGNAYAPIIATVKDRRGDVLEDQEVTFYITSVPAPGSFGTLASTSSSVTDEFGEARSYYHPPRGVNEIGENITAAGHSIDNTPIYTGVTQTTTFHTENILVEGDVDDIFLYQVQVDDALQGFMETTLDQDSSTVQTTEYYRQFFTNESIYGSTGMDIGGSGAITTGAKDWEYNHREVRNLPLPSIFQTDMGMGRKVIVSAYDGQALNPHTFASGCYIPMQPIDVIAAGGGEYDVIFDTSTYEIPVPSGTLGPVPSGILHSYFLVSPTTVTLQASVYNERRNQDILSNTIDVKLSIPNYLSGLWVLDQINQVHIDEVSATLSGIIANDQKVPLGWRLRSDNLALAAALDGVTFLDINPIASEVTYWDDIVDDVTTSGIP